jgi:hypothetical protein
MDISEIDFSCKIVAYKKKSFSQSATPIISFFKLELKGSVESDFGSISKLFLTG